jgi:putative MATE family efflux protein
MSASVERAGGVPISSEVAALAIPAIAQELVTALLFVTDRALVGRLGQAELASLHASSTVAWTMISVLGAVAIGATATVGRRAGARQREHTSQATRSALALSAALALLAVVPAFFARHALVRVLAPNETIVKLAVDYLEIVFLGVPFASASTAATACLRARGDAKRPLWAGAVAAIVNLALSAVLVPSLGVRGAAIGTAVALLVQCALLGIALRRDLAPAARGWKDSIRASLNDRETEIGRVTAVALVERLTFHAGYLGYAAMLACLGAAAAAAHQAILGLEAFAYPIAEGFAVAAATLVAQKLGARRPQEALRSGVTAATAAGALLAGFALLLMIAPGAVRAFSRDPGVIETARSSLYAAAASLPFMAFAMVSGAALRGAGRTLTMLKITFVGTVLVRLGATYVFGFWLDMGLTGAWVASGLDWLVQAGLAAWALEPSRLRR